jgi:transmembrane sensor
MGELEQRIRVSIAQEAADWFVRNRGKAVSIEERAEFAAWLKSSPLHVEEYLKTAVMSRDLHEAIDPLEWDIESLLDQARAEVNSNAVARLNRNQPEDFQSEEPRIHRRRWIGLLRLTAIAAAALLVVVGALWLERDGQRFGLPKSYVTEHAEQGSWLLPDGTSMSLNSDSAVTVRYDSRERVVQVERGQALFHVAHESARRFRVIAGESGVIAVGTEFDVFRKPASTLITVVEGKVAVFSGAVPLMTQSVVLPAQALAVDAGEQIQVGDDSRLGRPIVVNVQQAVAWMRRQIAFNERPLGEVAAEFNRYGAIPIVIQSGRLRELPISGVFNAYDTDSFVAFIGRLDGVEIDRTAERILIRAQAN